MDVIKTRWQIVVAIGGFLLLIDRVGKYLAHEILRESYLVGYGFLGWSPFHNTGIAFSLPLPAALTVVITLPILAVLAYNILRICRHTFLWPERLPFPIPQSQTALLWALTLVFMGALSNAYDRVAYGYVIDYLRIFTGIVNIADIMIAGGFLVYIWHVRDSVRGSV